MANGGLIDWSFIRKKDPEILINSDVSLYIEYEDVDKNELNKNEPEVFDWVIRRNFVMLFNHLGYIRERIDNIDAINEFTIVVPRSLGLSLRKILHYILMIPHKITSFLLSDTRDDVLKIMKLCEYLGTTTCMERITEYVIRDHGREMALYIFRDALNNYPINHRIVSAILRGFHNRISFSIIQVKNILFYNRDERYIGYDYYNPEVFNMAHQVGILTYAFKSNVDADPGDLYRHG